MPWENIGSVDTGEMPDDEAWILLCLKLAKNYVLFVCGEPPDDSKLEIIWHEHELADHPSLGVWYDMEEPCKYFRACEDALDAFNQHVSWLDLKEFWRKHADEEDEREEDTDGDYPL
ncbi:MAG: hypothetical protein IPH06_06305 [Alphaproteobacteria bacterium]|nr:hypothetical protein [Alphaproteobacteria bacterium]QQS57630.1 MAG: hypothetical protein IPN28_02070 [Alphaproteobacteria bacterium]